MPTSQKEQIVKEISEKFSKAKSIVMADYTGLDVNMITHLRKNFRESNVEYRVVKNTLAKLSFEKAGIKGMDEFLVGVNSYAISYDDPTLSVKVVDKIKKELNEKFVLKAAYFEGQVVGPDRVDALAKLPTRDELYSQFIGMLQSPMSKLVGTLQANVVKLLGVLHALEEKKK